MAERWVDRERRTGRLIRACYETYVRGAAAPPKDALYSLCKLTWITKGGDEDIPDNTPSVIVPALSTLLGRQLGATSPSELARELRSLHVMDAIVKLAARPVGFTNFYGGFRNIARTWLAENEDHVWPIVRTVAEPEDDGSVRRAYASVASLPPLPRRNAGDMPAFNLLTPLLACLDAGGRAPIINSREAVVRRLRMLGLSTAALVQQYDGLAGLIGQAGIDDAFALDTAEDDQIRRAMTRAPRPSTRSRPVGTGPRSLGERHDEDLEYLRTGDPVRMRRLHNTVTNALRTFCKREALSIEEGSEQTCLFDALVREYIGNERHLLIEVKTDDAMPMCRMAVGQLFDYRRQLGDRAAIDLAVLVAKKPSKEAMDLFAFVGIKVIWFDGAMHNVTGQVHFGGRG